MDKMREAEDIGKTVIHEITYLFNSNLVQELNFTIS